MALILACLLVHRACCQVGARQGKWVKSNPKEGNNPNQNGSLQKRKMELGGHHTSN
jgi:hypothetical protein